jgi:hypothetical protein
MTEGASAIEAMKCSSEMSEMFMKKCPPLHPCETNPNPAPTTRTGMKVTVPPSSQSVKACEDCVYYTGITPFVQPKTAEARLMDATMGR